MRHSTVFIIVTVVLVLSWLLILAFVKAATDEPNARLDVDPEFWHTVKRGDLVVRGHAVYRVKAVRAPHTLIVRRER